MVSPVRILAGIRQQAYARDEDGEVSIIWIIHSRSVLKMKAFPPVTMSLFMQMATI